ncbi:hypothetical protein BV25DRAFT_1733707 [Artomyces pyxidatus]|uniref:Uncharacterized protein n=1 Tax=Artomyces pyxidatus TaxID=48021 RepID=A0ACB8SGY2_9AGAM|nr:hypothetical protein BV25DRAFT_1733707 [Artomyces pyxidatus]
MRTVDSSRRGRIWRRSFLMCAATCPDDGSRYVLDCHVGSRIMHHRVRIRRPATFILGFPTFHSSTAPAVALRLRLPYSPYIASTFDLSLQRNLRTTKALFYKSFEGTADPDSIILCISTQLRARFTGNDQAALTLLRFIYTLPVTSFESVISSEAPSRDSSLRQP